MHSSDIIKIHLTYYLSFCRHILESWLNKKLKYVYFGSETLNSEGKKRAINDVIKNIL